MWDVACDDYMNANLIFPRSSVMYTISLKYADRILT